MIADLHRKGTTIFLTTHYIEEAERLCERIAFIVNGRIVQTDRTADLLKPVKGKNVLLISISNTRSNLSEEISLAFPKYQFQSTASGQIRVESAELVDVGPLIRFLEEQGSQVTEARRYLPSLEDVFVQVTGIEAELMLKDKEKAGGGGGD
jgi:ABC-2 type transport system ATP-binding protein